MQPTESELSHASTPNDQQELEGEIDDPFKEPRKKTRGKQKIEIEYIETKQRRQISFYKRKGGLIKKAHEFSTLTGSEVLLLIASETGHVYTFATNEMQPLITDEHSKKFIQDCISENENNAWDKNSTFILEEEYLKSQGIKPDPNFTTNKKLAPMKEFQSTMRPSPLIFPDDLINDTSGQDPGSSSTAVERQASQILMNLPQFRHFHE
jgi:hypothetical protein